MGAGLGLRMSITLAGSSKERVIVFLPFDRDT